MPGIFSKAARPARPGAYFNWAATPVTTVLPSIGSIVLVPVIHDWGPDEVIVQCNSLADFVAKFGPTQSQGWRAVMQCFEGEAYGGRGGAGTVLAYRMTGASAAKATVTIQNTTPAAALALTAKYQGTYGNNLGWRNVANSLNPSTQNDFQITLLGQAVETYTYAKTSISSLVNQINASSQWATATLTTDGVAIAANSTITPLVSGNDGLTLVAGDWTTMITNCSSARFSLFAPFDLTDSTILQSIQVWVANMNINGKRFMAVVGGVLNESSSAAVARSQALQTVQTGATISAAEDFVNLGVGSVVDTSLPTTGGLGTANFNVLSTSQLAPRVAGILAARGESQSLTFARLGGGVLPGSVMPTDSDVLSCFNAGVVCFGQDSNPDAPVRVEKGLTAYIGGDSTKPYLIYRNPKFLRTMQGIELDITDWATNNAIGLLQVNDATRALVVGQAHEFIQARADRGVIQDGFSVATDPSPPPTDNDEFVGLVYGIAFGRSVEQVFNTVYIS